MSDFVVREVNGKLVVYELGAQCDAPDRKSGVRCVGRVVTPDQADGTWSTSVIPGFDKPLRVFNVGYGSCGDFCLQLCRWHCRHDIPDEITGLPLVRFDLERHSHLVGAEHLEEILGRPTSYRNPRGVVDQLVALYRYWDADDLLLYVGITGHMGYRERSHIKGSSWMDFAVRSTIERFPCKFQAEPAEREAIQAEHPLFNHKHNESREAQQRLVDYLVRHGRTDLLAPAVSRG